MSELFIELFSEEIPSKLQIKARTSLLENFQIFFEENDVSINGKSNVFSTPNRLVIKFEKVSKKIKKQSTEIKGPSVNSPSSALEGFLRSNKIKKNKIYKKKNRKRLFLFL